MKRLLLMGAIVLAGSMSLQASGTAAGTDITNQVTLNYKVGGVDQTAVDSNQDTFKVDRKIDVTVAVDNSPVDTPPGNSDAILSFTVTNTGNDQETYDLSTISNISGDDFDPTSCTITDTSGNSISQVQLNEDANQTVQVHCQIPDSTQVHADDNGTVALVAAINGRSDDSGNADDPATVQNVFADAAGTDDNLHDGKHSDRGTYHIISADLSASKTSCVVNDPVNGTSNPKRIPGATIRYAIEVDNNGNADATDVKTTDTLNNNLSYSSSVIKEGACDCAAGPSGNDAGTTSNSGQDVTLDFDTVSAGQKECAYIEATIN